MNPALIHSTAHLATHLYRAIPKPTSKYKHDLARQLASISATPGLVALQEADRFFFRWLAGSQQITSALGVLKAGLCAFGSAYIRSGPADEKNALM